MRVSAMFALLSTAQAGRNIAGIQANSVSGVFSVTNDLRLDNQQ